MTIRIAVVQQDGNPGRPDENRDKAVAYAEQALAQGGDIVLFHEELVIGYSPDLRRYAEPVDGPTTRAFQALLGARSSLIIFGLTERDGEAFYISAPVVAASGVVANYRKTHLWWAADGLRHEPTYYRAGDQLNGRPRFCDSVVARLRARRKMGSPSGLCRTVGRRPTRRASHGWVLCQMVAAAPVEIAETDQPNQGWSAETALSHHSPPASGRWVHGYRPLAEL